MKWHLNRYTLTPHSYTCVPHADTYKWLVIACWATAAFTGVTRNFEITPMSLPLVVPQTKTPFLEGSANLSPNCLLQRHVSFSRVSLSISPKTKALLHIPKVTEIWDIWICWGLPGSLKFRALPSKVSKNKRKIYYECKVCWEGKGTERLGQAQTHEQLFMHPKAGKYSTWLLPVPTLFGLWILALFSIQQNGLHLNKWLGCSPLSYSLRAAGTEQQTLLSSTWVDFLAVLLCKLTR